MSDWKKSELDFCKLMEKMGGATLIDELALQYVDIDAKLKDGRTVSIKEQTLVSKYNTVLFEYLLVDTDTYDSMDGSFLSCKADLYAITYDKTWLILDSKKLKKFVLSGIWSNMRTTTKAELYNKNIRKAKHNRTYNYKIPLDQLLASDAFLWKGERI